MIAGGIDAGSRTIKAVLLDAMDATALAAGVVGQGVDQAALARRLWRRLLRQSGLRRDQVARVVATGYARGGLDFADTTITEITCHARGVQHLLPHTRTVIDIGGQDSKLIRLDAAGQVQDFTMNDRCAAGTGRFLEVVASRLRTRLQDLGALAGRSRAPAAISSMCVVFAETEIVGLLAAGAAPEDIVAGVQAAIARRIAAMASGAVTPPVVFTGGGAMVPGMDRALALALGQPVMVAPQPQMTGALGAALLAACEAQRAARQAG